MSYPIDLVLVRHGESEGNIARDRSRKGDASAFEGPFSDRHTSKYRLTDVGRSQARKAGRWLRENISEHFDRYYTSEYVRAMETAALLGFENANWLCEFYLRERDKGEFGGLSEQQREDLYLTELKARERDSFYWTAPGGESIAQSCLRVERYLEILRHSCGGFKVIAVCHGNIMRAFRIRLERMQQSTFQQLWGTPELLDEREDTSLIKNAEIHYTQILWYSRRDPVTLEVSSNFQWLKSICPWASSGESEWMPINRPTFSNDQLLAQVHQVPQIINNTDEEKKQAKFLVDNLDQVPSKKDRQRRTSVTISNSATKAQSL
jgi:broad specificity phosphatase PhoE